MRNISLIANYTSHICNISFAFKSDFKINLMSDLQMVSVSVSEGFARLKTCVGGFLVGRHCTNMFYDYFISICTIKFVQINLLARKALLSIFKWDLSFRFEYVYSKSILIRKCLLKHYLYLITFLFLCVLGLSHWWRIVDVQLSGRADINCQQHH